MTALCDFQQLRDVKVKLTLNTLSALSHERS